MVFDVLLHLSHLGKQLWNRIPATKVDERGGSLLHVAAEHGQEEVVRLLLEAGAICNLATTHRGITPLHLAAMNGHLEVLGTLLEAKASHDQATTDYGGTALHLAAFNGRLEVVRLLLQVGVNFDQVDEHGETALHLATENGHLEVVRSLLAAGASDSKTKDKGLTALHVAAQEGHLRLGRLLLESGVVADCTSEDGSTALHMAAEKGGGSLIDNHFVTAKGLFNNSFLLVKLPIQLVMFTKQIFSLRTSRGHLEVVKLLLKARVSPNQATRDHGMTVPWLLMFENNTGMALAKAFLSR